MEADLLAVRHLPPHGPPPVGVRAQRHRMAAERQARADEAVDAVRGGGGAHRMTMSAARKIRGHPDRAGSNGPDEWSTTAGLSGLQWYPFVAIFKQGELG